MTREEAIDNLQDLWNEVYNEDSDGYDYAVAIDMAIKALQAQEPRGVYQCFHCGSYSVVWGADFDFSDYGYDGEGIVHSCHCGNCGAEIEYRVPITNEEGNNAV